MPRSSPCTLVAASLLPATLFAQAAPPQSTVISADTALRLDMAAVLSPAPAPAPQAPGGGGVDTWHFSVTTYVWVPGIDGDVTVGGTDASLDVGLGDAFEHPGDNWGAGGHIELPLGRFTVFFDGVYLDFDSEGEDAFGGAAQVSFTQWVLELGAAFTAIDTRPAAKNDPGLRFVLEPLAGLRAHILDLSVSTPFSPLNPSDDKRWLDGFIGVRGRIEFGRWVGLYARADIGAGGSDLTWSALAGVDFRFDPSVALQVGYRLLKDDFSDGTGFNEFKYDALLHGPFLALTFRF